MPLLRKLSSGSTGQRGQSSLVLGFLGKSSSHAKAGTTELHSQAPEKKEESRNEGSPWKVSRQRLKDVVNSL